MLSRLWARRLKLWRKELRMADIFRLKNEDGTDGNWAYFSETKGDIVDCGQDEQEARARADKDSPKTTIAQALANDASTTKPAAETTEPGNENSVDSSSQSISVDSGKSSSGPIESPSLVVIPGGKEPEKKAEATPEKPARSPLSPVFIKKLVEQLGRNTTNISIEFERFIFKLTGYATEELAEDDADVEIIRMGWDAIWQSYLAGKDPPLWMILAFGYSCTTVRLIASAKRIEKREKENDTEVG